MFPDSQQAVLLKAEKAHSFREAVGYVITVADVRVLLPDVAFTEEGLPSASLVLEVLLTVQAVVLLPVIERLSHVRSITMRRSFRLAIMPVGEGQAGGVGLDVICGP